MLIYIVPKINIVIPATTSDTKTQNPKKLQKRIPNLTALPLFCFKFLNLLFVKMHQQQNVAKCINNRKIF